MYRIDVTKYAPLHPTEHGFRSYRPPIEQLGAVFSSERNCNFTARATAGLKLLFKWLKLDEEDHATFERQNDGQRKAGKIFNRHYVLLRKIGGYTIPSGEKKGVMAIPPPSFPRTP
jgi:hypothetical protein